MTDEYTKWIADLQAIFTANEWPEDYVLGEVGREGWDFSWENGYTPQEAFDEELDAAAYMG